MDLGSNVEEHQEYLSGPYIALINGTNQQREPNKKFKKIVIVSLITILLILILTISIYLIKNKSDKIDDLTPNNTVDPYNEEYKKNFEEFKSKYNKKYDSLEEENERFEIFKQNMNFIKMTNNQGFSYTLEMNEFGDLTREEFIKKYMGYNRNLNEEKMLKSNQVFNAELSEDLVLPSSLNWIELGCVNPVRNQKNCGSCWAFSAIASLEGGLCAQTNKGLFSLSEQQLIDCTRVNGNNGCNGGTIGLAFQYAMNNKYFCKNDEYPYLADEKKCRVSSCKDLIEVPIYSYRYVLPRTIDMLKMSLVKYGPISVAIQADEIPFQFYKKGVFDAPCGTRVNHGVVVVGYGIDADSNKEYWLVRNSWGENWGEKGYIKLALHSGRKGTCGILVEPIHPIISID